MKFRERKEALEEARKQLSWQWPRAQLIFILALTGTTSFLISWILLSFGVTQMAVRYPISITFGYLVFIGLIGIWLQMQLNGNNLDIDIGNIPVEWPTRIIQDGGGLAGRGGDFGGGGAGGRWDSATDLASNSGSSHANFSTGSSGGMDVPGLDADDFVWIVLAILALLAGLLAIGYVVYIAPVLFAEVLADSLFAAGLYKSVKKARGDFWLRTVIWKTIIPAIVVLVFFSLAGYFVQLAFPEASSLGDAMRILF